MPILNFLMKLMQCCVFIAHRHLYKMFQAEEEKALGGSLQLLKGPSKQLSVHAEPEGPSRMLGCGLVVEAFASVEMLRLRLFAHHSLELEVTGRRGHFCTSTLLGI